MTERRGRFRLFIPVLVALMHPAAAADPAPGWDEATVRATFRNGLATFVFPLENPTGKPMPVRIHGAILDRKDIQLAAGVGEARLERGTSETVVSFPFELGKATASDPKDVFGYRLSYRIEPSQAGGFEPLTGLVSLARVSPELFTVVLDFPFAVRPGAPFEIRVQSLNPVTRRPVAGVLTQATIDNGDGFQTVDQSVTDSQGMSVLRFPKANDKRTNKVRVIGQKGDFRNWVATTVYSESHPQILLGTDKGLYQPGQTLKARLLVFDPRHKVFPGKRLRVTVSDQNQGLVFSTHVQTNEFGVADTEWTIPDEIEMGGYSVRAETEEREDEFGGGFRWIEIRRYQLPNFVVHVDQDAPFHLPGEPAGVSVRAEYLSGRPVAAGTVHIVRTADPYSWSKDPVANVEVASGPTEDGVFRASLDLDPTGSKLDDDSDRASIYIPFTAYFTDRSDNRVEERRFNLLLTRETLHVRGVARPVPMGSPAEVYLSATHPDGSPAIGEITLTRIEKDGPDQRLTTIRTNRFGVAKTVLDAATAGHTLLIEARDAEGNHGSSKLDIESEGLGWRVETARVIHAPGDPIVVEIHSSEQETRSAFLDVFDKHDVTLHSERIAVRGGRLRVVIPYRPAFSGPLTVAAYSPILAGGVRLKDTRNIVYPENPELAVELETGGRMFKPRDKVSAHFEVADEVGGRARQAALGFLVYDRAVSERVRTDRAASRSVASAFLPSSIWTASVGGVTLADLTRPDLAKPAPDDLETVAEVLLFDRYASLSRVTNGADGDPSRWLFDDKTPFGMEMKRIEKGLRDLDRKRGLAPGNADELERMLGWLGFRLDQLRDPWGNPLMPSFEIVRESLVVKLISAGADEEFGVGADPAPVRFYWPYFRAYEQIMREVLDDFQKRTGDSPHDADSFKRLLRPAGIDFDDLHDPWGNPYRVGFRFEDNLEVLSVESSGKNGVFDGWDDPTMVSFYWPYFTPTGRALTQALDRIRNRTGEVVQDQARLTSELSGEGFDLKGLRDHWGNPYRSELKTEETRLLLVLTSGGPNGLFEQPGSRQTDDFEIWRGVVGDLFKSQRLVILAALKKLEGDPLEWTSEDALRSALIQRGVDLASFTDFWERPFRVELPLEAVDVFRIPFHKHAGDAPSTSEGSIEPVRQSVVRFRLVSLGEDGVAGTADDFDAVRFAFPPSDEFRSTVRSPLPAASLRNMVSADTGGVFGLVVDESGAILPGVTASIQHEDGSAARSLPVDMSGRYAFARLPPGVYTLDFELPGFRTRHVGGVPVLAAVARQLDVTLEVGTVIEAVIVTSSKSATSSLASGSGAEPIHPVRRDFPETLVWMPSLTTGPDGKATFEFQLADSVTTWRMEALASTLDGRVATAEKEITAFQPFFVEFDPPPVWTQGDRIDLRPLVRNYLDHDQSVQVTLKPSDWMKPKEDVGIDPYLRTIDVSAGGSTAASFPLLADTATEDAKIQFTALGGASGDAIEKTVAVHPNGERITKATATVIGATGGFDFSYPAEALPGTLKTELVLFPGFLSHAIDGADALLRRPLGCAEQTISTGFANLMILRALDRRATAKETAVRARRLVQESVDRLRSFQTGGGVSYWSGGEPSPVITAYALRFLSEAGAYVKIDEDQFKAALRWLLSAAQPNGTVPIRPLDASTEAFLLTGLSAGSFPAAADSAAVQSFVSSHLGFVRERLDLIYDPHVLALYAYASLGLQNPENALDALAKLDRSALLGQGQASWVPAEGTAFYGWGIAGKVETTALALRAFLLAAREFPNNPSAPHWRQLALSAALFLTTHKDASGGWQSTQSTVAALAALFELANDQSGSAAAQGPVEVWIDGRKVDELLIDDSAPGPLHFDLSAWTGPATRRVELHRPGSGEALAQLIRRYYRAWSDSDAGTGLKVAGGFQLNVEFDKTESKPGESIEAHVRAQRHNWPFAAPRGMALVEIGLPPGAEVERDSLEAERVRLGWRLGKYEVSPNRVTVYLWPGDQPIDFRFRFRPRFRMEALSVASRLYDYYNPAAEAKLAPIRFSVR